MISVVCVYNDNEILDNFLLKSLKNQSIEYELILLDNTNRTFESAAQALNYGGKKAKEKYIMFVHQDVDLSSNSWLEDTEKILDSLPNLGILGVAGRSENVKGIITIIKDGYPPKPAGDNYFNCIRDAQTLDECLVIVPASVFEILTFDEKICDNWHLYVADYCLSVKEQDYKVYLAPVFIYHRSAGYSMSEKYYTILEKLMKKHGKYYKRICINTGCWYTSYPLRLQRTLAYIKKRLKRY
jgi:Glycosyltransferase like family